MVFDENIACLVITILTYKPTRAFREKPKAEEVDDGGKGLESCRESPRPFGVDAVSTVCRPCCDDGLDPSVGLCWILEILDLLPSTKGCYTSM